MSLAIKEFFLYVYIEFQQLKELSQNNLTFFYNNLFIHVSPQFYEKGSSIYVDNMFCIHDGLSRHPRKALTHQSHNVVNDKTWLITKSNICVRKKKLSVPWFWSLLINCISIFKLIIEVFEFIIFVKEVILKFYFQSIWFTRQFQP